MQNQIPQAQEVETRFDDHEDELDEAIEEAHEESMADADLDQAEYFDEDEEDADEGYF